MNYNANAGVRQPQGPGRKIKRVSDLNAVGPSVPTSQYGPSVPTSQYGPSVPTSQYGPSAPTSQYGPSPNLNPMAGGNPYISNAGTFNGGNPSIPGTPNYGFNTQPIQPTTSMPQPHIQGQPHFQQQQQFQNFGGSMPQPGQPGIGQPGFNPGIAQGFEMFQQPIVQDMAMQYGQRLADQGKQLVENQFEKWIPVTKLKYYFAVDNNYVINKLRLLLFPFIQKDWSLKYDQDNPVQPRYDINAPDLYIPTMAYITYVVVAGLMLGMQNRFSPEQLGIQASSALAYSIFELVVYSIIIYVANITTNLKTLDLVAFSGYKFVIIVFCILTSIMFRSFGYYLSLIYCSLSLGFFLLRTLKTKVLQDTNTQTTAGGGITYDPYGNPQQFQVNDYSTGRKRKLYFLFIIVSSQAFFSFLLSKHLKLSDYQKI